MNRTRRALIVLVAAIALIGIGFLSVKWVQDNEVLQLLQKFSVTLHNQSDYDIVSVETGIIKGTSLDIRTVTIKRGKTKKIKPNLTLTGEGAIYIKLTDSRGEVREQTICGYTEYLSGSSVVEISKDTVKVEQNCR